MAGFEFQPQSKKLDYTDVWVAPDCGAVISHKPELRAQINLFELKCEKPCDLRSRVFGVAKNAAIQGLTHDPHIINSLENACALVTDMSMPSIVDDDGTEYEANPIPQLNKYF